MVREIMKIMSRGAGICCTAVILLFSALPTIGSADQPETPQRVFSSPDEACKALVTAVESKDHGSLRAIFGPLVRELEPGDPVEQATEFDHFANHIKECAELVKEGEGKSTLIIGAQKWPFPVPIVKKGDVWLFDTESGREEILTRRIGHNELFAINVCRSYVDAQRDYYSMPEPDGDQLPKYAQRKFSTPGKRDGLYWPTAQGEKESPLGPLVAKAREEGYLKERTAGETGPRPFHGYYFRILKKQGSSAPGGKFSYVINGNMVAGHALVAYPARWGVSGIMTFMVNQRGRVYQKNLGPKTAEIAPKMKMYNPDQTWKLAEQ